jgi:Na+/H+ antiporter NhaC
MAILMALVIPVCHELSLAAGYGIQSGTYYTLMVGTISSVLAGSVWGDHCSPISDTTILSSMASGCDHVDHVRTQMPYALGIGILGMLVGDIPTAFGLSPWISIVLGTVVIVLGVRFLFKKNDAGKIDASEEPGGKSAVPEAV